MNVSRIFDIDADVGAAVDEEGDFLGNLIADGVTVFNDLNNNGELDPGESSTVTSGSGGSGTNYTLSGLIAQNPRPTTRARRGGRALKTTRLLMESVLPA